MTLEELLPELVPRIAAIRRDLHAHPELAFGEWRTADIVAAHLERLGLTVRRGLAGTGVIGTLQAGNGRCAIGLRADMDALPLEELNCFAHRSTHPGQMHACGHDGHTAMLLGAAEALTALRHEGRFEGTVHFIFQPAEEHEGGARVMLEQGLLEAFPLDAVYGLHNWPGLPIGEMAVMAGPVMAGADRFEILVTGRGGHAAMPQQTTDTVLAGAALVQALQMLVGRNTDPLEPAVLSVTRFHAGHADNVLPEKAQLGGTVRTFSAAQQALMESGMRRICAGIAAAHDVEVQLEYARGYPPAINSAAEAALCAEAAARALGRERVRRDLRPSMGAEDFAYLLQARPGCYVWLGNGVGVAGQAGSGRAGCMLHSPHYDFNDAIIPLGIAYWVRLVERALPA
ncbi:Hippurate hydrolase [Sterolibacterium denitrificans]|uniref:Hippurate hydrolase n=1 Tax=Sterolibacterium denitrificans TaxID=157592 RepID=A0A7Z7MVP1_9PROT|nr:M20 aminoacylase family protein [Sterolibacterium denitrificans]SMB28312.1 Hippurate hydrolase [Sterolibacterium denitrificans]